MWNGVGCTLRCIVLSIESAVIGNMAELYISTAYWTTSTNGEEQTLIRQNKSRHILIFPYFSSRWEFWCRTTKLCITEVSSIDFITLIGVTISRKYQICLKQSFIICIRRILIMIVMVPIFGPIFYDISMRSIFSIGDSCWINKLVSSTIIKFTCNIITTKT